jgi:hypothetical protein
VYDKLQFVDIKSNDKLKEALIKLKVFKAVRHSRGAAKDL